MNPPENGLKYMGEQVTRLWNEKASKEAMDFALQEIAEINRTLQRIQEVMAARPLEREKERKIAARERKMDRRWMVGTVFTGVGLIIAAIAILLPALAGGG